MGQSDKTTSGGPSESARRQSTQSDLDAENKQIASERGLETPSSTRLKELNLESNEGKGRVGQASESAVPKTTVRLGSVISQTRLDFEMHRAGSSGEVSSMPSTSRGESERPHDQAAREDSDLAGCNALRDATREQTEDPHAPDNPLSHSGVMVHEGDAQWAPDDFTTNDTSDTAAESQRSRFRTAPGGGKNRISGGRLQAKVYVSPVTVKPSTGNARITAPVKVHDVVEDAVRTYQTEPSLIRRRQSSLPPKLGGTGEQLRVWVVGIAVIFLLGCTILWIALRGAEQGTRTAPPERIPAVDKEN